MVNQQRQQLDATFAALADPTRRAILEHLGRESAIVSELAKPFSISLPAVSKHLRVLEDAGLIRREREGRNHRCRLQARPMAQAMEWLERYRIFWDSRLDSLESHLHGPQDR